jgi:hypothetical protein
VQGHTSEVEWVIRYFREASEEGAGQTHLILGFADKAIPSYTSGRSLDIYVMFLSVPGNNGILKMMPFNCVALSISCAGDQYYITPECFAVLHIHHDITTSLSCAMRRGIQQQGRPVSNGIYWKLKELNALHVWTGYSSLSLLCPILGLLVFPLSVVLHSRLKVIYCCNLNCDGSEWERTRPYILSKRLLQHSSGEICGLIEKLNRISQRFERVE